MTKPDILFTDEIHPVPSDATTPQQNPLQGASPAPIFGDSPQVPKTPAPLFPKDDPIPPQKTTVPIPQVFSENDPAPAPAFKKQPAPVFDATPIAPTHLQQIISQPAGLQPAGLQPAGLQPAVAFSSTDPVPSPVVHGPVAVSTAFEEPKDPLVEKILTQILEAYPDKAKEAPAYRHVMQKLFPLTFDVLTDYGQPALQKQQAVVTESKRLVDLHVDLCVQEQISLIMQSAKAPLTAKSGSLLQKLKQEVHKTLNQNEGPAQWYATLHRLKGSLKLCVTELPPVIESGQDALRLLTQYSIILKTVAGGIQDTSLQDATNRRLNLFLGALQQVQINIKQLEQLQGMLRTEMQQIDETMTVTLPALGFMPA